ncbi:T9SS C-terminal target domain-containing protein [Sphingobacteriales bacterium UPWRP_1]|nr:hypothetical protein BVG80_00545 [Sphingobacteriales bacterium TSM_CSM]PSJ72126.1 T9SS C-terminal target domain-containing protein [Sphingobacteriales bacterium UPWRP_1]
MVKYFLAVFATLGSWICAVGQTGFEKTFGEPSRNELTSELISTSDGGFALVGYSASYGTGSNDMYLVKTNAAGQEIWYRTYGTNADDRGAALQQTGEGGFIIAGITGVNGQHDIYLLKTDAEGAEQWSVTIGNPDTDDCAAAILATPDNGFVILGGNPGMCLIKTNASGAVVWQYNYGNTETAGQSLQATPDGGYLLCGTAPDLLGGTVMLLVKTDAEGNTQWTRTVADAPNMFYTNLVTGRYAIPMADGGYLAVGHTHTDGYFKLIAHKTNNLGDAEWTNIYEPGIAINADYGYLQIIPNRVLQETDGSLLIAGSYLNAAGNQAFTWHLTDNGALLTETLHSFGILPLCDINSTLQLPDGNLAMAGYTSGQNAPGFDALLFTANQTGTPLWTQTYGMPGNLNNEWGYDLLPTIQNNYLLAGQTNSYSNNGNEDVYLLKTDPAGNVLWWKNYDYQGFSDVAWEVAPANGGGYAVSGFTANSNGLNDTYLLKIDEDGNKLWEKTFGISANDRGWGISATPDNGFAIAAQVSDTLGASMLGMALKTDADGNVQWSRLLGYNIAVIYHIKPTSDGGYIVAGRSRQQLAASTETKAYLAKLYSNGQTEWEFLFGNSTWARFFDVTETSDGAFMAVGSILDVASGNYKMYLLKVNGGGGIIWENTVPVEGNNFGNYKVLETADGNYVFTGNVELSQNPLNRQGYLLKTNTYGNELWSRYYGNNVGTGTVLYDACQNADGGFMLFGGILANGTTSDCYLIRTDSDGQISQNPPTGVLPQQADENPTLQIWPNPNNGIFNIGLTALQGNRQNLQLTVFNLSGQKVLEQTLITAPDKTALQLQLPGLQPGLYTLQLQNGYNLQYAKMVKW